jgi:hypothetical protein
MKIYTGAEKIGQMDFGHGPLVEGQPARGRWELLLDRSISAMMDERVTLDRQVRVQTKFGIFWLDLTAKRGNLSLAIEVDGQYHDWFRDLCRDSLIIQTRCVSSIYRVTNRDLDHARYETLSVLDRAAPWLFSVDAARNLEFFADLATRHQRLPVVTVTRNDARTEKFLRWSDTRTGITFANLVKEAAFHLSRKHGK